MKQTIEYGQCSASMLSTETILNTGVGAFGRKYELRYVTEGYEPAGSAMRHIHECYRVVSYDFNGTRHSQAYLTMNDAAARFASVTTPIVEVTN